MGLHESGLQGLDVVAVALLQLADLGGQGENERVFGLRRCGSGYCIRPGSGAPMLDPAA